MAPSVVLVCGPAGAGKSTHAMRLERHGYVRLSFDELAWSRGYREHPLAPDVAATLHDELQRRLLAHVRAGDRVVVDSSFWSRASRDVYRQVLAPSGVVPVVHYVDTPRDVVLDRLTRRQNSSPDDVTVTPELAAAYLDGFEVPTPEEGPTVVVGGV